MIDLWFGIHHRGILLLLFWILTFFLRSAEDTESICQLYKDWTVFESGEGRLDGAHVWCVASWGSGAWRRLRRTRTSLPGRGAVWNEFRVESLTVWVPFFVESKRLQVSQIRTVLWVVSMCWFWDILSGVAPCTAASAFCGSADGRSPTWTMLVIVLQFQSLKRAAIPNQSNAPFDARRVEVLVNRHWPFHACKHQTVCFATICATVRWPWCVYQLTGVPEGPRMATSNSRCKSFSKIPSVQK